MLYIVHLKSCPWNIGIPVSVWPHMLVSLDNPESSFKFVDIHLQDGNSIKSVQSANYFLATSDL